MNNLLSQQINDAIHHYKEGNINQSKKIALEIISNYSQNSDANYILGIISNLEGNYHRALKYFDIVLKNNNRDPELWNYRAIVLTKLGSFDEAIINFENAINLGGKNLEKIYSNIVIAIFHKNKNLMNRDYSKAIFYSKKGLAINFKNTSLMKNYALALIYSFNFYDAIKVLKKVIKIDPHSIVANENLGLAYKYLTKYDLAERHYKKAVFLLDSNICVKSQSLNRHNLQTTLGEVQLRQKNFKEGWKNYISNSFNSDFHLAYIKKVPLWDPSLGFDKNIVIISQHGLGDQILYSSIIPDIYEKFRNITLIVDERLVQIMRRSFQKIDVVGKKSNLNNKNFDCYLPMTALGLYFRSEISDFNPDQKILFSDNKKTNNKRLKCALSWKSNNPEIGFLKSLDFNSLRYLLELLNLNGIDVYNIQYTDEKNDIKKLKNLYKVDIKTLSGLDIKNDITALAEFISSCDFTINISNTNAHLSAALGTKSYLLLPKGVGSLWYWENEHKGKCMWYSSIERIVQIDKGDWIKPIHNLIEIIKNDYLVK